MIQDTLFDLFERQPQVVTEHQIRTQWRTREEIIDALARQQMEQIREEMELARQQMEQIREEMELARKPLGVR